jgi:ComF family protein
MHINVSEYWHGLVNLIYPPICKGCGEALLKSEKLICLHCIVDFPKTNFHNKEGNPVEQIFWGRLPIKRASSGYFFTKEGSLQNLLHALKYKGVDEIGILLGEMYGHSLREASWVMQADGLIPVPLHKKKQKLRGYNQSEKIAQGLSQSLEIPVFNNQLKRNLHSTSQTKKKRYDRFENVNSVFGVEDKSFFKGKDWILVDDVITTGSTLEACARVLMDCKVKSVSIITIACGLNY